MQSLWLVPLGAAQVALSTIAAAVMTLLTPVLTVTTVAVQLGPGAPRR